MAVRDRSAAEDEDRRPRRPTSDRSGADEERERAIDDQEGRRDGSGSDHDSRRSDAAVSRHRSLSSDRSGSPNGSRKRSEPRRRPHSSLSADRAAERAIVQISRLTGREPETVTGLHRSEEGWTVAVEVVEDRRIPSSSDILGVYEVELDSGGDMIAYRRSARYPRGRTEGSP